MGIFLATGSGFAQVDSTRETSPQTETYQVYLNAEVGVPIGNLRSVVVNDWGNLGAGVSAGFLLNPYGKQRTSPIFVGLDFGYLALGVDKINGTTSYPPLKTTFNVYTIGPAGRLMLSNREGFTPFIDGFIGAKIYNTRTKVDKNVVNLLLNDNQPEVINTTNDTSLGYSVGVGFFNRKGNAAADGKSVRTCLSMRILYLWGAEARYVLRDSITIDANHTIQFTTGYTRTDMVMIQAGIVFY